MRTVSLPRSLSLVFSQLTPLVLMCALSTGGVSRITFDFTPPSLPQAVGAAAPDIDFDLFSLSDIDEDGVDDDENDSDDGNNDEFVVPSMLNGTNKIGPIKIQATRSFVSEVLVDRIMRPPIFSA
jgi:hypothetical protein